MKSSWFKYILLVVFSLSFSSYYAQIEGSGLSQDSTLIDDEIYFADSTKKSENGFLSMFEGDPGRAALYSLVLPGAGQIYNKKWIKAPIVWGLEAGAIVCIVIFNDYYQQFALGYQGMVRDGLDFPNPLGNGIYTDAAGVKRQRDNFKKYRDYSIIGLSAAHLLGVIDAFVDRHLMEFDVDEDISFDLGPTNHGVGLTFTF